MCPATLHIGLAKFSKASRQQKELGQYWGPDHVPAEFLAALKENLKPCLDDRLLKSMFSDKMDEQLKALQTWKVLADGHLDNFEEITDLVLKWLTWVFFMTNIQVLKLALEVLGDILQGFTSQDRQLTDREAQILLPNLLERSGHNNSSIRDMMCAALRQALPTYSRIRTIPMSVHALGSKSKRTAAAAMRFISSSLDRQLVVHLVKTPKELDAMLKLTIDKDADVRKAAQQTVSLLSLHVDSAEAFVRICERLPDQAAKQAVRQAAARLESTVALSAADQGGEGEKSFVMLDCSAEASIGSSGAGGRASVSRVLRQPTPSKASSTRQQSPGFRPASTSPGGSKPRALSAPRTCGGAWKLEASSSMALEAGKTRTASPLRKGDGPKVVAPASVEQAFEQPSVAASVDTTASLTDLALQMGSCSREEFKDVCGAMDARTKQVGKTDFVREAPALGQALLDGLKSYFGSHACAVRCRPLMDLLAEMCGIKDFVRALPDDLSRSLLRELLKHLHCNGWTAIVDDGPQLLRKTNLACVVLLNSMSKPIACGHLLDLGMRESEVVGGSLVGKCLKKLYKNMSSNSETLEKILTVALEFCRKARGKQSLVQPGSSAEKDLRLMVAHARELAASVRRAYPELAESWRVARVAEVEEKDQEVIEELLGTTESSCLTPAKSRDSSLTGGRQSLASLNDCLLEAGPQSTREEFAGAGEGPAGSSSEAPQAPESAPGLQEVQ